jgi:tRNA dimethylallyltransferase
VAPTLHSGTTPFYIVGPTGSGKSALAIALAEGLDGEIINADAYQVYCGLAILTAQPSAEDCARVPHHLYGFLPLSEEFDAAQYAKLAEAKISEVQTRGRRPIIVGGSGLYVKALTHGLSNLPPVDAALRVELAAESLEALLPRLLQLDPQAASHVNLQNPRHVQRALEICLLTGMPATQFKQAWKGISNPAEGVFINPPREELYARINRRTASMFATGVVAEVGQALLQGSLSATAAKAIGIQTIADMKEESAAIAEIQQATRRYAKRQITWFKRETYFAPITTVCTVATVDDLKKLANSLARE